MKALILIADGFEDLELFYPMYRLQEEGISVTLAGIHTHPVTGLHGYRIAPDMPIHEINPAEYDLLILTGGDASEKLRLREEAVGVARFFMEDDRPVAAICHGPQVLISAGSLNGRNVTCAPGIRDDAKAAGANYRDEAVVVDGNLITSRGPDDLPDFCQQMIALCRVRS